MASPTVIILPGWRNSGPGHGQTRWANSLPSVLRVEQDDWVAPVRQSWVARCAMDLVVAIG